MNAQATSHASADLALAVYLEPYVEGRGVLLLGQANAPSAQHLERFAARLDIIDPSSREPGGGEVPELPFEDESFDLVLVSDLTTLPDPRAHALRELRRVLAQDGVLVLVTAAPAKRRRSEASPEETLERLLAAQFDHVRVVGQAPMFGYTVSDLDPASRAELTIDSSLTREAPERAERLVALGSDLKLKLEPRLWVQVPASGLARGASAPAESDGRIAEQLRRAEEEARRALVREGELSRELERERKAREAAESAKERYRALERKLLAIEADYDDAVGRVRYFESLLLERESAQQHDREQRAQLERELARARSEREQLEARVAQAEHEREAARASAEAAADEHAEGERRLRELAGELSQAQREAKRQEQIARDLLEELRGHEQRALVAVEHDARVSELEAERERAVQRALEAEVARESAQMRVDELRALLERTREVGEVAPNAPYTGMQGARDDEQLTSLREERALEREALHVLRGERTGLALRLAEAEEALVVLRARAADEDVQLDTRLALAEARAQAAVEALGDAEASLKALRAQLDEQSRSEHDVRRVQELEDDLAAAERRIEGLTRELEEADRFAEDHAQDAERIEELEAAMERLRERLEQSEDDLRARDDELFGAREKLREQERALLEAQAAVAAQREDRAREDGESASRLEQLSRRENELRSERDDAHAALAEARAILSHLAVRVGADTHDLPAIMQALEQQTSAAATLESLRQALSESQSARSDAEYELARAQRQLEEREQRIRELEDNASRAASEAQVTFEPPEV